MTWVTIPSTDKHAANRSASVVISRCDGFAAIGAPARGWLCLLGIVVTRSVARFRGRHGDHRNRAFRRRCADRRRNGDRDRAGPRERDDRRLGRLHLGGSARPVSHHGEQARLRFRLDTRRGGDRRAIGSADGHDLRAKSFDNAHDRDGHGHRARCGRHDQYRRRQSKRRQRAGVLELRRAASQRRAAAHPGRRRAEARHPARHLDRRRRFATVRNAGADRRTPLGPRAVRRVAQPVLPVVHDRERRNAVGPRQHDALREHRGRRHRQPADDRVHEEANGGADGRRRQLGIAILQRDRHRFGRQIRLRVQPGDGQSERLLLRQTRMRHVRHRPRVDDQRQHRSDGRVLRRLQRFALLEGSAVQGALGLFADDVTRLRIPGFVRRVHAARVRVGRFVRADDDRAVHSELVPVHESDVFEPDRQDDQRVLLVPRDRHLEHAAVVDRQLPHVVR